MGLPAFNRLAVYFLTGSLLADGALAVAFVAGALTLGAIQAAMSPAAIAAAGFLLALAPLVLAGMFLSALYEIFRGHPGGAEAEEWEAKKGLVGFCEGVARARTQKIEKYWQDRCAARMGALGLERGSVGLDIRSFAVGYSFSHGTAEGTRYVQETYFVALLARYFAWSLFAVTIALVLAIGCRSVG